MSRLLVVNDFITDLQLPPVAADEDCELVAEKHSIVPPSVVSAKADRPCMVTSQVTEIQMLVIVLCVDRVMKLRILQN